MLRTISHLFYPGDNISLTLSWVQNPFTLFEGQYLTYFDGRQYISLSLFGDNISLSNLSGGKDCHLLCPGDNISLTLSGGQSLKALAAATTASSHSTGCRSPRLSFSMGVTRRCRLRPSHANRDLSDNHSSLISYKITIAIKYNLRAAGKCRFDSLCETKIYKNI